MRAKIKRGTANDKFLFNSIFDFFSTIANQLLYNLSEETMGVLTDCERRILLLDRDK